MNASFFDQPCTDPHAPYFSRYVSLVPAGDLIATLDRQIGETLALFLPVPEPRSAYRYAPGKWSLKQVAGHIADTEQIMAYRLLAISRGEEAPLPSFDQDRYVDGADFDSAPWDQLTSRLRTVRAATISLLSTLPAGGWERIGTSSGHPTSARALAAIIAGHELWHQAAFRRDYLPGITG